MIKKDSSTLLSLEDNTGYRFEVFDEIDSTNNYLKAKAAEGQRRLCVIADRQTGGKGRLGRTFESPTGGLYMSFICDPSDTKKAGDAVTAKTAVATARAIEKLTGLEIQIKWVNDLYCGGRKLCGILAEGGLDLSTGKLGYLVIGIGVNLTANSLSSKLSTIATSVEEENGPVPDKEKLAVQILKEFEQCTEFREEYRRRQFLLGQPVEVHRGNEVFPAVAEDLDENCAMILRLENGERITLSSGEISLRIPQK